MTEPKNKKGGARPKARPDDARGGARRGAGQPGAVRPLRMLDMGAWPEAADGLARLTRWHRRTDAPGISQQAVVAGLVANEIARLGLEPDVDIGPGPVGLVDESPSEIGPE